ncbi:MAG: CoA transferase [Dehalococcoidia bacterium]
MAQTGPLAGMRVVESGGFAVAFAGRLLADAGAEVVRIIDPAGDLLATEAPFFSSGGSIQDAWYNAGKTKLTVDLSTGHGRTAFLSLVNGADILLEDWTPGTAVLGQDALSGANSALAHVSVTPMGLTGPRAQWKVPDIVANALSGSASVTGNASSGPTNGYGNQTAHTVGLYAAICALAAQRAAQATGEYQRVDLSGHEALVSCTEQVLMEWFFPNGTWNTAIAPRQGSLHWSGAYEVYPGKDGHGVMVTAALGFATVLLPWIIEDGAAQDLGNPEKYPSVVAMIRDLPYVMKVMREWVATYDGETLYYEGQKRHQPFGVVWNIEEALTRSPQIDARGYIQAVDVPGAGKVGFPGRLFRTSADGPRPELATSAGDVGWDPRPSRQRRDGPPPGRPLEGIRILDFTHVLAGPFGTRVLGDLGADVIKVGTGSRSGGANSPDHPYYVMWNRNKRHMTIDMSTDAGRGVARKLAAECDVIIENFSAGVLKRWGLDRAGLHETNSGVTVISMGGMGQDGPWKDFVTFAPTIHALTGLTYLTNPPGEHALGYGFSLTDHLSGLAGALAALEGIAHRDRTGEGIEVDLSQYELGLGLMAPALIDYLANGVNHEPVGNRHPFGMDAPQGIYPCAGDDRWIAIAVRGDVEWRRLGAIAGIGDARFETHSGRLEHQDALDAAIAAWTRTQDGSELAERCQAAGIAAGPVQNARDLAEHDPQLAARGFFGSAVTGNWGQHGIDQFPARFNGARPPRYDGVHAIGADTFDVMTGLLGVDDEAFAELAALGALS